MFQIIRQGILSGQATLLGNDKDSVRDATDFGQGTEMLPDVVGIVIVLTSQTHDVSQSGFLVTTYFHSACEIGGKMHKYTVAFTSTN
ncbi:hypothetical protein GCM10028825_34090 [Spirosoma agri]